MGKGIVKLILINFLVIVNVCSVFAYIDPGTGGYLASSFWSIVIGIFAAVVSFLGVVFRKYLIIPVKSV